MNLADMFAGLLVLVLLPAVLCGGSSSGAEDGVCFERVGTGDKLFITSDSIYFTDPSDPFACHVFKYERKEEYDDGAYDGDSRVGIRITDSKCFLPGPSVCRKPARFFVDFGVDRDGSDNVRELCLGSQAILIGTFDDTCCDRIGVLVGRWELSANCSTQCDCSADCTLLPKSLVRDKNGHKIALHVGIDGHTTPYDGSLVVTADPHLCFKFPFVFNDSSIVVSKDVCEPPSITAKGKHVKQRCCDDPEGTYFCSQRLDTVTLYYTGDFCQLRTGLLGATFQIAKPEDCPETCECPRWK